MMKNIRLFAFLAALLVANVAEAQVYWSSPAGGCVPDATSIATDRHVVGSEAGSVFHNSSKVGLITLFCPVSKDAGGPNPSFLSMTYAGTTAFHTVQATFIRINRETGQRSVIATVTSAAFLGPAQKGVAFSHTLDFNSHYYHVRVELSRPNTGLTPRIYGVALGAAPVQ